jgi:outer membrane protein
MSPRSAILRRTSACAVAVLVVSSAAAAQADSSRSTVRLSLDESIALALRQATTVQLARADERVAAAQILTAYGRFLPSVTVGANTFAEQGTSLLSQTSLLPYDATFHGVSVGLSAGMTLFDGFRDRAGLREAIAQRDAASLTLKRAREEIATDVTEAYYRVVLDDRLTVAARGILNLTNKRLAQIEAQVDAGVKSPPDLYRQQALAREGEAAVIASESRGSADRISLLRRLRLDPHHDLQIVSPIDSTARAGGTSSVVTPSDLDESTLTARALLQRADLAAAGARRRGAEADLDRAHGVTLPRVSLQFDVVDVARVFDRQFQNGVDLVSKNPVPQSALSDQLGHQFTGVVTLGVSLPLFDRWQARGDIERAEAQSSLFRFREDDLRDKVIGDVVQAVDEAKSSALSATAARAQVSAAQKAYDAVSGRYDVGMATFVEVATAQSDLARARNALEAAVVGQALAKARLALAVGGSAADTAPDSPPAVIRR